MEQYPNPYSNIYNALFRKKQIYKTQPLNDNDANIVLCMVELLHFIDSKENNVNTVQNNLNSLLETSSRKHKFKRWLKHIDTISKINNYVERTQQVKQFRTQYMYPLLREHSLFLIR